MKKGRKEERRVCIMVLHSTLRAAEETFLFYKVRDHATDMTTTCFKMC
jgi:hypothetical protein